MYYLVIVAVAGIVAGTTFISSEEEGILRPVPKITSTLKHDPSPLIEIASASQVKSFFSGPCVTGYVPSPAWWKIDLVNTMKVTGVTVKNIGSCCHPWLGNFSVLVGNRMSANDDSLYGYQTCVTHSGMLDNGTSLSLPCQTPVTGRYVLLTSKCVDMFGTVLSCELGVFSTLPDDPIRKTAVFTADQGTAVKRGGEIDCARKCMRDVFCVRFDMSAAQECRLYNSVPKDTPGTYSLYKLVI